MPKRPAIHQFVRPGIHMHKAHLVTCRYIHSFINPCFAPKHDVGLLQGHLADADVLGHTLGALGGQGIGGVKWWREGLIAACECGFLPNIAHGGTAEEVEPHSFLATPGDARSSTSCVHSGHSATLPHEAEGWANSGHAERVVILETAHLV